MTTYYVKAAGSNGNTGLSDAQAWATPEYAESQLRNTTAGHKVLLKCGDTFNVSVSGIAIRISVGGTSPSVMGEFGSYYMSGGVETEGVSGAKPILKGDYGGSMVAGASFLANEKYAPPKGSENKCWYQAGSNGTFPSTFPSLPTTEGATVVIGGVTFTCRVITVSGTTNGYNYSSMIGRNSSDTANYCRFRNLSIKNSRGTGWDHSINDVNPSLNYFEIIDVDFDTLANAAIATCHNNAQNVQFIIDGVTVRHCGKAARDSNFSTGGIGGARPGWLRCRGGSTGPITRIVRNCVFSGNWQEGIIAGDRHEVTNNINHAAYVHFYCISGGSNGSSNNIFTKNMCIGSNDSWYHRYTGYTGYAFYLANETAGQQGLTGNQIYNNVTAYTGGALYLGNRSIAPGSIFDNSVFAFNTSVDDRVPMSIISTSGHTNGVIKNNAFIQKTSGLSGYTAGSLSGISCDYNYWSTQAMAGNAAGANDVYGDVDGIAEIYKQAGWQNIPDLTSDLVSSKSASITFQDFRPASTSPLLGAGVPISGITTDINGDTRSNPPTIGAWETAFDAPPGGGGGEPTIPSVYPSDMQYSYGASGTARTINKPSNLANGNMVILELDALGTTVADTSNFTNVSGFTLIGNEFGAGSTTRPQKTFYRKIITDAANEPAQYTFDSAGAYTAHAHRVDGCDTTTPIGQVSSVNSGGTGVTSIDITGITTTDDNVLMFSGISTNNNATPATAFSCSGMTELYEINPIGTQRASAAYVELRDTAGATGNRTIQWTNSVRVAAMMFEILPGTAPVTDDQPPGWTVQPYVSDFDDTSIEVTMQPDEGSSDTLIHGVAYRKSVGDPTLDQIQNGEDASGVAAESADDLSDASADTNATLTFSGITIPKVRIAIVAEDDDGNRQLQAAFLEQLLDPPSGNEYTEVTIDSGAAPNSALSGLNYSVGDVIVYPSITNEDSLPISISGDGTITITRSGNTDPQTWSGYLWSLATGSTQVITYQDPFYQAYIGPFGNDTDGTLVNITVYVVAALDSSEDGTYDIPSHRPLDIIYSVAEGVAVPVQLDGSGIGIYYNTTPGLYYGEVYTVDGSYQGKLGYQTTIGVTVA